MKQSWPQPRRVLVVQTAYLGDVVLAQPLWAAAKSLWPKAAVDVLVQPQWAPLVAGDASLGRVLSYAKRGNERGAGGLWRMSRTIREGGYDLALCPHPSFRSALLLRLAGVPMRVGFADSAGAPLFTHRVRRDTALPEVERALSLLAGAGARPSGDGRTPRLTVAPELAKDAAATLARLGLPTDRPLACAAPGSVWATKRWLPEGFAEVLSDLADDGMAPAILGGPDDLAVANLVQDRCRTMPINLAGRLTLPELAFVLSRAAVLVSNDSGPMHIAGAVGTPVVAVFGSTTTELGYAPVGSDARVVERYLPCRPCGPHGRRRCPLDHFHCMRHVAASEVTAACRELLARPA